MIVFDASIEQTPECARCGAPTEPHVGRCRFCGAMTIAHKYRAHAEQKAATPPMDPYGTGTIGLGFSTRTHW